MGTHNQHSYTTNLGTACLAGGVYAGTIDLPQTGQSTTYANRGGNYVNKNA
ncbi:MAG: hypothetical protein SFH39_13975 [Candidatus Magnetobacterium sp. LHC-1]|nr:hypothetical protein [Nitrospirota bacterium]